QRADPYDRAAVEAALARAVAESERPSLIITRSHIGYGAPKKQDTREAHGEPLGAEEVAAAKRAVAWPESPPFLIPPEVRALFAERAATLRPEYDAWHDQMKRWRSDQSQQAPLWDATMEKRVPKDVFDQLVAAAPREAGATRSHSNVVLQRAAA